MAIGPAYGGGASTSGRRNVLVTGSPFLTIGALETWASSNIAELTNEPSEVSTAFVDNQLFEYQGSTGTYLTGQWADVTPDGLTPEMMAALMSIVNLADGEIPQGSGGILINAGMQSLADVISTNKSIMSALGSFLIGLAHSISAGGENIAFTNLATRMVFHPVWQTYLAGNTATSRVRTDLPELPAISDKSADLTNPTWSQAASSGDQTVRQVVVDFTSPVVGMNILIEITNPGGSPVGFWEQLFGDYDAGEQTLIFDPPFDLRAGQISTLITSAASGNVVVKGNAVSGVPYQRPTIATWVDEVVALLSDIQNIVVMAADVSFDNTQSNGLLAAADDVQESLELLDATGIGAAPRTFTDSFFCSYGEFGNQDQWYGDLQGVTLIGARGQANANRTFEIPDIDELNAMFDDMAARGLSTQYTLTVGYLGGNTSSIARNSMTIRAPSVSNGFDRNELPTTIAQGAEVTYTVSRIGGVLTPWERVGVTQAVDPVATIGELVFQAQGWNNRAGSLLPTAVLQGYAYKVFNSDPNDGTLRAGLLAEDRFVHDGDWAVWTANSFTSWADGANWFVIDAGSMSRISREATNFLMQVSEIDNRVDIGFVQAMTQRAFVWLSENPLAEAPFLTPSSDPVNPRGSDAVPYVGGTENRNADSQFQFGQNFNNSYITIGITPSFINGHPESTIDILFRDENEIVQRLNLASDFTFRDDATYTNGTVRHYTRNTSINYGSLEVIEIVVTEVQRHFALSPDTIDVTRNIPERAIDTPRLALPIQTKLSQVSQTIPPSLLFDSPEQKTRVAQTVALLPGATHETDENIVYAFFDSSEVIIGVQGIASPAPVAVPAGAVFIGFLPEDTHRGTVRFGGILYEASASVTISGTTYFLTALPVGLTSINPSPSVHIGIQSLAVVEQGLTNKEAIGGNTQAIIGLTSGVASARNITDLVTREEMDVLSYTYTGFGYAVSSTPVELEIGVPLSIPARDVTASILYGRLGASSNGKLLALGTTDFIRVQGEEVQASRFRALVPATSTPSLAYVSSPNGAGSSEFNPIVMNAGFRDSSGDWQPESSVLSVTQNLPTSNEPVRIKIDGFINGLDEGIRVITLPFGQTSFVSLDYVTTTGFNTTVVFQARYRNNNTEIELELLDQSPNIAVDAAHFNILFTYEQTTVVPEVPAGRDWVRIGNVSNGQAVFSIGMLTVNGTLNFVYTINNVMGIFDTLTTQPTGLSVANQMSGVAAGGWLQAISFDGIDEQQNQQIFNQLVLQAISDISDAYIGTRLAVNSHEINAIFHSMLTAQDSTGNIINLANAITGLLARVTTLES